MQIYQGRLSLVSWDERVESNKRIIATPGILSARGAASRPVIDKVIAGSVLANDSAEASGPDCSAASSTIPLSALTYLYRTGRWPPFEIAMAALAFAAQGLALLLISEVFRGHVAVCVCHELGGAF